MNKLKEEIKKCSNCKGNKNHAKLVEDFDENTLCYIHNGKLNRLKGRLEVLKEVEGELKLCKICRGTHGQWITKDEMLKILASLREKANEKKN